MKSLIILKSLAKQQKRDWVRNEELENYFIDIDVFRRMYSSPDLITPEIEILSKGYGDIVYRRFLEVLVTRMSKGCLIVLDPENEACSVFETLALIFGYTVFWVVSPIPQDYITRPRKYNLPCYPLKRRMELERDVTSFLSLQLNDKRQVRTYQDVLDYWGKQMVDKQTIRLRGFGEKLLAISDLHSNISLLPKNLDAYKGVIVLGDYIDGPETGGSRKLTDIIASGSRYGKNEIWLEGNHELRLRRWLGIKMLQGTNRKELSELLMRTLTPDFLEKTAHEYDDMTAQDAKEYLQALNKHLFLFAIVETPTALFYCSHAGIKYPEQLDPKFIGNVVYGSRDINRIDREFSERSAKHGDWSVHAHCKYVDNWETQRWPGVLNISPKDEFEVIFAELINNKWNVIQCQNEKLKLSAPQSTESD